MDAVSLGLRGICEEAMHFENVTNAFQSAVFVKTACLLEHNHAIR